MRFNGLPVVLREPVLYASDGAEDTDAGVRWEYVALGVTAGAAAVLALHVIAAGDAVDEILGDIDDN